MFLFTITIFWSHRQLGSRQHNASLYVRCMYVSLQRAQLKGNRDYIYVDTCGHTCASLEQFMFIIQLIYFQSQLINLILSRRHGPGPKYRCEPYRSVYRSIYISITILSQFHLSIANSSAVPITSFSLNQVLFNFKFPVVRGNKELHFS